MKSVKTLRHAFADARKVLSVNFGNPWGKYKLLNLVLVFCPTKVAYDHDRLSGWTSELRLKRFRQKTYVFDVERYLLPPDHPNCRCQAAPLISKREEKQ